MLRKVSAISTMLATATAVAACGASGSPKNTSAAITAPAKSEGLKLAECMRAHGVSNFPDPSAGGGGGTQIQQSSNGGGNTIVVNGVRLDASAPRFQSAMNACQKDQPHGPPLTGAQLAQIKQGAVKMAACMRAHGVPNFADPQVSTGPGGHGIAVRIGVGGAAGGGAKGSPPSPAFQRAMNTCQPDMRVGLKGQKTGS